MKIKKIKKEEHMEEKITYLIMIKNFSSKTMSRDSVKTK